MLTFKEYQNQTHLPKVLFGIDRCSNLNEEIHPGADFYDYIGPEEHAPKGRRLIPGVYTSHDPFDETLKHYKPDGKVLVFKSPETAHMFSMSIHRDYGKKLDTQHRQLMNHYANTFVDSSVNQAVQNYTAAGNRINYKLLRNSKLNDDEEQDIDHLDAGAHVTKTPDDMVVYSGTSGQHAAVLHSNRIVHHPSYLSTSIAPHSAASFATRQEGDLIKIHVPKGHPGIYASGASDFNEYELILPRDLNLHIHHDKRQIYVGPNGLTHHVHHATIE